MFNTLVASFKDFLLDEVSLSVVTIQNWMLIAMAILVVLLIAVILSAVKNSKKNKAAEEEKLPAENEEENKTEKTEDAEPEKNSASDSDFADFNENKAETPAETQTASSEEVKESADTVESKEDAVAPVVPVKEKKKKAEPVKEEKTEEGHEVTKTRFAGKSDSVFGADSADKVTFDEKPAKTEAKEEKAEDLPAPSEEADVAATEESGKTVPGKFELCNSSLGGFRYHLLANNGQLLYESRDYKTIETCRDAIAKFVNSVEKGTFSIKADKFGNYKYSLKSATSNNVIYVGESYTTKKSCLNSVESVKRFAPVSPVVDATIPDFTATAMPFEIPAEAVEAVKNKQGAIGKWVIDNVDTEDPASPFVFLLYANNGQLLYESRDYKSYDNCRKGVDAFVSAVENGYFIIDDDKFGRYKFFLRSKKTGSQAEYVGQNYDDKSSCESSAVSVYKFALLTPVNLD
ncbi:MAG: DUF1508 domain-containing protein [Clostridiales bacterium]|nr:DUF1508 domain-containing protein [Clostridiales bacterium]MDY4654852.1 DUF1508 domain-containing protein [Eubacteriales bacterium]